MKNILLAFSLISIVAACSERKTQAGEDFIVGNGQMPDMVKDKENTIHLVYGNGDSLLYASSTDNGSSFSKPSLLSVLPHVFTFATRGPQIAITNKGLIVTACTSLGDIFSFYKEKDGGWMQGGKVNDTDTTAKEGLMALSADGGNAFAVWLDLRGNKRNKIYGAKSDDGGKTWSKNIMIYTSPDTTVCECCKPSVVVKGSDVHVMFRNFLQGNRDLYLTRSNDGGTTFGVAQKLGNGNWKLDGCPMDGGGLIVDNSDHVQTVWRREGKIYTAVPGMPEKEIGEGKGCTITTLNGENVYAWSEKGEVIIMNDRMQRKTVGKGSQPVLKAVNNDKVICIWENDKQIHASVVTL